MSFQGQGHLADFSSPCSGWSHLWEGGSGLNNKGHFFPLQLKRLGPRKGKGDIDSPILVSDGQRTVRSKGRGERWGILLADPLVEHRDYRPPHLPLTHQVTVAAEPKPSTGHAWAWAAEFRAPDPSQGREHCPGFAPEGGTDTPLHTPQAHTHTHTHTSV